MLEAKVKKWPFDLEKTEKAKIQKWQIWRQILSDLPTYLHQISSVVAWHTYLPKNLTSYVNAPLNVIFKCVLWNKNIEKEKQKYLISFQIVPGKPKLLFFHGRNNVSSTWIFMVHTMYYITYHVVLHTEFTLRQFVALL